MNGRFFLDTNIFGYMFDQSAPSKAKAAERLVELAVRNGKGLISYQVVQEFFNLAFKKFTPRMLADEAYGFFVSPLRPLLRVPFSESLIFRAISLREKHSLAWYDSLILAAAIEGECKTLYTEDFQHGRKIEDVKIVNPFI